MISPPPATGKESRRSSAIRAGRSGSVTSSPPRSPDQPNSKGFTSDSSNNNPSSEKNSNAQHGTFSFDILGLNGDNSNKMNPKGVSSTIPEDPSASHSSEANRYRADSNVQEYTQTFTIRLNSVDSSDPLTSKSALPSNKNSFNPNNNNKQPLTEASEEDEDESDEEPDAEGSNSNSNDQINLNAPGRPRTASKIMKRELEKDKANQLTVNQPNNDRKDSNDSKDSDLSPPPPPILRVDAFAYMKKGASFLKHSQSGSPHFRHFQLSDDHTSIFWISKQKKNKKDSTVYLSSIQKILLGQQTAIFARQPTASLINSSFSIVYSSNNGATKTLDLIAKDPNDYTVWTQAIQLIVEMMEKAKGDIDELFGSTKILEITAPIQAGRGSTIYLPDVTTGKTANDLVDLESQREKRRRSSVAVLQSGDTQKIIQLRNQEREISKKLIGVKEKFNRRKEELKDNKYISSPLYESMFSLISRMEEQINLIDTFLEDGDFEGADKEL